MDIEEKKDFLLNAFGKYFPSMPADLRALKARECLKMAIIMHLTIFDDLSKEEIHKLQEGL